MSLPPGPPLPASVQTAIFLVRPTEFLEECNRRYGPIFTVDTLLFGREVCIADPDMIKQVFTGDPADLRAGEANAVLEPFVGPRSVLLLDGPQHLRHRRLMMPPFHGERMLAYAATMREMAEREIASFPVGRPFALQPIMQRITLGIILRTVFGLDEGARLDALARALKTVLDRQASLIDALALAPAFRWSFHGVSPWDRFQREMRDCDDLIYRQIAERRAAAARGDNPGEDVLAMLLAARDEEGQPLTDAELRDELMTLLLAGHETTTTMLCWAFDLILGDPRVESRLRAEIEASPDLASIGRLEYLEATIREALRLRPVISAVGRKLHAPITLGGYHIPAGEVLSPQSYLTHLIPSIYPDPKAFRPERFLDKKPDPYAWLPFGGGIRRCLGMAFALYELKVVIATVLSAARLKRSLPRPAKIGLRGFTLVPERGAEVVLERRGFASQPVATAL